MTGISPTSNDYLNSLTSREKTSTQTAQDAQDRFLKLLVTQMKNQDPLNPMDNAQVTSQMAQLSTVSGIDKLNTTLQSLMGSYQSSQTLQASSMIERGVLTEGSSLRLTQGKSTFGIELSESAENVIVSIHDASGKMVHSMNMGTSKAGTYAFEWDGKNNKNVAQPDGMYTVNVKASSASNEVAAKPLSYGVVMGVSPNGASITLDVQDIGTIDMNTVKKIL